MTIDEPSLPRKSAHLSLAEQLERRRKRGAMHLKLFGTQWQYGGDLAADTALVERLDREIAREERREARRQSKQARSAAKAAVKRVLIIFRHVCARQSRRPPVTGVSRSSSKAPPEPGEGEPPRSSRRLLTIGGEL